MKIATDRSNPIFQPVTVSLVCESQLELDTLTAIAARTVKIPEVMFDHTSMSVRSLQARGITPGHVRNALAYLFRELLDAGGKP